MEMADGGTAKLTKATCKKKKKALIKEQKQRKKERDRKRDNKTVKDIHSVDCCFLLGKVASS